MGRSRKLLVNWKCMDGAAQSRRKLYRTPNADEIFCCPIKLCLHSGFKSSRGLRKHINSMHPWYYYFNKQPEVKREKLEVLPETNHKVSTSKIPSFSLEEGIGYDFLQWLCTPCGGGKTVKEANQIGKRAMKIFYAFYWCQ